MKRDDAHLGERFEAERPRLRRIAERILGSSGGADDALQESWVRVSRAGVAGVSNFEGWLTTVVGRVCLDALQWRATRREELMPDDPRHEEVTVAPGERPEDEALLADSLGVALRILIDALAPVERVAFVLHDMFDVPFEGIAPIVGRTPEATRQLASRARRRVRGAGDGRTAATQRSDELVRAFLAASRQGNFSALIALLDPAATLRMDAAVAAMGGAAYWGIEGAHMRVEGAETIARKFSGAAQAARAVFIDGEPGAAWFDEGDVRVAFRFALREGRISAIDLIGDPLALAQARIER